MLLLLISRHVMHGWKPLNEWRRSGKTLRNLSPIWQRNGPRKVKSLPEKRQLLSDNKQRRPDTNDRSSSGVDLRLRASTWRKRPGLPMSWL